MFCECAAALLRSKNTGISWLPLLGQIRYGCEVEYAFHLSYIKLFKPEKGFVADIPSWVPDLSAPARPFPLRNLSTIEVSAARSLEPSFSITGDKGRVLKLKAAVLDVITVTGDCRSTRFIQPIWRLLRILFKLPGWPEIDTYLPADEPIVAAFWWTLVAGATHGGDEGKIELTDAHLAEWFAIFAAETYRPSEGKMRTTILQELDEDDLDLTAEPNNRRRRSF